ncbi:type VI secretion system contractile sheath large subunit [Candidatus Cytomitobacter primus]|uniref:Type VI secretion system contractile sheath large subunit n=1 Tax=Candidatus Cytomitobacter primus TaxID=2066024 RepID=A0A5C0UHC8_9PROT|nr:type VI secretion system contractile sheath large subunit [Candidatus Cytomitobacter primus]QEK38454.1 type VI secretion system contractile sheath large subunit [Candidatus Cytomitobacter primus]
MGESIQKSLLRVRPPRVRITYDVETGGAVQKKELPFVLGIISDLYGHQEERVDFKDRRFTVIDRDNFEHVMESINPKLNLSVNNVLEASKDDKKKKAEGSNIGLELFFNTMDDFNPVNIVRKVPELNAFLEDHELLVDLATKLDSNNDLNDMLGKAIADKGIASKIVSESKDVTKASAEMDKIIKDSGLFVPDPEDKDSTEIVKYRKMIASLFRNMTAETTEVAHLYPYMMDMIAKIDEKISLQLDEVLHHEDFQTLEASWRGMHYVVMNSETGTSLKIRIFAATKDEVQQDLERAIEFDQSVLFRRIYEEEFGTLGGSPYSCLLGDFYIGKKPTDVSLIRKISQVAAAAHTPFLAAANPNLFDLNSYNELHVPRDLKKIFENSELTAWNSFRDMEDSRYVNLFLPRVLVRLPYGEDTIPVKGFNYNEAVDGMDNSKFCWGNPAYAMALRITTAFAQYGWTAAIRGIEGGGLVENLPAYTFKTSYGDIALKCPTEVMITDRREKELSDLGFISLCHNKGTDKAVFFSAQSTQRPKEYDMDSATANAALSARLTYMLNVSRFAHYIKMLMRDKIGSFASKDDVQLYLNNWIANYVFLSDQGGQDTKAKYPLREAAIEVVADDSNPGSYKAVIFLKPHFQLEELEVSLRLVATLPGQE